MRKPLISVILPCYNALPFLPEALESIIHQTYQNLEIICLDDGSTDNSADVLFSYSLKDKRIKCFKNEENLGLIETLNKGVLLAKGNYIARMDADDISHPKRIEILLNEIEKKDLDVISCATVFIAANNKVIRDKNVKALTPNSCFFLSFLGSPVNHAGSLSKSNVIKENLYEKKDHNLHVEDYELWARLCRKGYRIGNINSFLYFVRISPKRVSLRFENIQKKNFITCAEDHFETFFKKPLPANLKNIILNRMSKYEDNIQLKRSFDYLSEMIQDFVQILPDEISLNEKKELKRIVSEQKVDIFLQSLKFCSFIQRLDRILFFCLKYFSLFFTKGVMVYIWK